MICRKLRKKKTERFRFFQAGRVELNKRVQKSSADPLASGKLGLKSLVLINVGSKKLWPKFAFPELDHSKNNIFWGPKVYDPVA